MPLKLLFTTNPGIEDIVVDEVSAKLSGKPIHIAERKGRVIVEIEEDKLYLIESLRSIHRARILLTQTRICAQMECLKQLHDIISSLSIYEYITPHTSFAVRVERAGNHEYTSLDIAREAGDAIISVVRERYGLKPYVDLDYPDVIVSVDVIDNTLYIGIELGGDLSWHRRGYRVYEHPAALKPTIAYAMLMLSKARDGESILDPMCGGGTIPIEAAYIYEDSPLYCMDYNKSHVIGAHLNALSAMVAQRINFIHGDARELSKYIKSVDVVVSNPPYGIRLGDPRRVRKLYRLFISELSHVLQKTAVFITTEHHHVKSYAEEEGLRIVHERIVAHGGLWPKILVLSP